jgi:flagellar motor switch/type III secretory pathway protein FliN
MPVFRPTAMNISTYLSSLSLEGQLNLESPHGEAHFTASRSENQIQLHFENAPTFRHFLSSVRPHIQPAKAGKLLESLKQMPQDISVTLGRKEILSRQPDGQLNINYRTTGWQWLRWRLSRMF